MLKTWNWSVHGKVRESAANGSAEIAAASAEFQPVVIRAIAKDWPLVRAGQESNRAAIDHILAFDRQLPAQTMMAPPEANGRFFYADDMRGYNFAVDKVSFRPILSQLAEMEPQEIVPAIYAGSNPLNQFLPGFMDVNRLPLDIPSSAGRIWIGNASHVAPHFDVSDNIAVVAVGRRRFTLFPPHQTKNMYVGPLDMTIAGQPVSMVDIREPDLDRFPLYADAMQSALQVDLEPGDAIFIPTLWWHCVEALDTINVLVNYWHNAPPNSSPFAALIHAMMAVRDLGEQERAAWQNWFEHFVFDGKAQGAADHLPEYAKGVAGPPSRARADAVRSYILRSLGVG
jgi:Cupin-like domain